MQEMYEFDPKEITEKTKFIRMGDDVRMTPLDSIHMTHTDLAENLNWKYEIRKLIYTNPVAADAGILCIKDGNPPQILVEGHSLGLMLPFKETKHDARIRTMERIQQLSPDFEVVLGNEPLVGYNHS
jgi:hypothetical protein